MKNHGQVRSTVEPLAVEITASKVFVASDIEEITVTMEEDTRVEFQFNLIEYDKDEYIRMMSDKNESLEQELTNTQIALCDVYEMIGQKGGGIMARVYADLIRKGVKTIDDVPERLCEEVRRILEVDE